MIELKDHSEGVVLPVHAQPGARSGSLRGEHDGSLKVSVTQVAEKGKTNKSITALLSKTLHVRKSQIELISGATSSQKKFLIRDESVASLTAALARALR